LTIYKQFRPLSRFSKVRLRDGCRFSWREDARPVPKCKGRSGLYKTFQPG